MANFNRSSNMTATVTVLAAALSMVNLAYDASMINTLLLSNSFVECKSLPRNVCRRPAAIMTRSLYQGKYANNLVSDFQLNSTYIGLNVAIVNVGNVVSGPFTGPLMDRVGRKRALLLGNILQVIAVVLEVAAINGE